MEIAVKSISPGGGDAAKKQKMARSAEARPEGGSRPVESAGEAFDDELAFPEEEGDGVVAAGPDALSPLRLTMPHDVCGMRLDRALSALIPAYSRSRIQQWIEAGFVTVDGKPARPKTTLLGDEVVDVTPQSSPEEQPFVPEPVPLQIVWQDRSLIVLDKTAGLVVHPAAGNWSGTLLNGLLYADPALAGVPRAGIVHRLDKDTTGLMVVARSLEAQTDLVRQLQARTVRREYLALVWGKVPRSGTVDAPIGRHARDRLKMAVSASATAKQAVTHYRVVATGAIDSKPVTLLHCRLETGRTHQIRVHLQSLGFPLVGDALYGKPHLARFFPRQALHAFRLGLLHPATREPLSWEAPLPGDMQGLLEAAGLGGVVVMAWDDAPGAVKNQTRGARGAPA